MELAVQHGFHNILSGVHENNIAAITGISRSGKQQAIAYYLFTFIMPVLLFAFAYPAQSQCLTNSLIINTGYNPVSGLAVTPVANLATPTPTNLDPHWTVTAITAATYSGITAAGGTAVALGASADVITTYSGGWVYFSGFPGQVGNWINCVNANYYSTSTSLYGPDDYSATFTRKFHLCSDDTVTININIACDNYCKGVSIDGAAAYFSEPSPGTWTSLSTFVSAPTTLYLAAGWHTINVQVVNYNNGGGIAENYGSVGIWGTVSSATGSNSIVMESDTSCGGSCSSTIITCNTLSMPDSLKLCKGDTATIVATISGSDSVSSILWSPATGLSSTTVVDPLLTAVSSGWYYLTIQSLVPVCSTTDSVYVQVTASDTLYAHTDTVVCSLLGTILLNAPSGFSNYTWSTGATTANISVAVSNSSYWVESTGVCTLLTDTFNIGMVIPDAGSRIFDTSFCTGGSVTLYAPSGYTSYAWSDGDTATSDTASVAGTYWVMDRIIATCNLETDTFHVTVRPLPLISLGNDTTVCPGDSLLLSSPVSSGNYLWSTGSTDSAIQVMPGTYILTVTNNGCTVADTITVGIQAAPVPFSLGPDTTLCKGDVYRLSTGGINASWNTGVTSMEISVTDSGTYWASVTNACGIVADSVDVKFEPCDIFFPNAFSPNNDGLNDYARAVGNLGLFRDYKLSIYNRWGQRIFYTTDIYAGWDGKFNGVTQEIDTYFYMITYNLEGKGGMLKGDLTLVR